MKQLADTRILALTLALTICCTRIQSEPHTLIPLRDIKGGARVQEKLQGELFEMLRESDLYTEAFGLFSQGGWSDDGQVVIISTEDGSRIQWSPPNKPYVKKEQHLESAAVVAFRSKVFELSDGLEDQSRIAFDALHHEFVHLKRTGKEWIVDQRILMTLIDRKHHTKHWNLIQAFKEVVPSI